MDSNSFTLKVVIFCGVLALSLGFVQEATSQSPENPSKGFLQNISLNQLTSGYLQRIYPDVTFLKISNSKIEKIDKYAFDYLIHLNLLELSDNDIQDVIDPQTFYRLPGLEILILKNLKLRHVNLNLTHVQELILARNEIEAFDGESIVGKNVNFLDLSGNGLEVLTGTFANMSKLSMIDVSKNKISKVLNVFEENVNLLRILASENKIASTEGLKLPWLKTLNLFANKIAILDSKSFSEMSALEELVLAFNNIRLIEDAFKDLVELKYLNLAWNNIEELHPKLFRNNLYLTKLTLEGNKIRSLEKFQNPLHHLTHLDLSHNQLTLLDDEFFWSTPSLQVLDLSFNSLKTLTDVLAPLTELKILNAAYNDIIMVGYELSMNHQLSRVNLSSNSLQKGLILFKNNQLLNGLDVSDNDISYFCDGTVPPKSLLKVNLKGNLIKSLDCLKEIKSLCEVDLRSNPLTCGDDLDDLILNLAEKKSSPYKLEPEFQSDLLFNQCDNLSLNRSFSLWNLIRREFCPKERDLEAKNDSKSREWGSSEEEEQEDSESSEVKETSDTIKEADSHKKPFIVLPIGWIKNDEINKSYPIQNPQSERTSWEKIEENAELLNGFEDEELGKRPRFSWYTIALILIVKIFGKNISHLSSLLCPHGMSFASQHLRVLNIKEVPPSCAVISLFSAFYRPGVMALACKLQTGKEGFILSWQTITIIINIISGLSLTLTCFNLVVFLYIKMKVWKRSDVQSPQKYTFLYNEVYKNTTEPTKVGQIEGDWMVENQAKNKIFTYGKINEILLNFRLNKKDKDSESATNILINPTSSSGNC